MGVNGGGRAFPDRGGGKVFGMVSAREGIGDKITQAGEPPAYSFTPPGTAGNYQPPHMFGLNPERARALLAEAGYPAGKGFPAVSYLYDNRKLNEDIAVEIQSMISQELGIHMELVKQEWKVYLNSTNRLDYDFCRSSWIGDSNDPNSFLECFISNGGNNRTGWSNPNYDKLIAAAAKEADPQTRLNILAQA